MTRTSTVNPCLLHNKSTTSASYADKHIHNLFVFGSTETVKTLKTCMGSGFLAVGKGGDRVGVWLLEDWGAGFWGKVSVADLVVTLINYLLLGG
jgi:hypothetical protein